MHFTVEAEKELWLFVFVDVDSCHKVGPLPVHIVETTRLACPLVDQIVLMTVADADLILSLAAGRETVARIDQRHHQRGFAQLELLFFYFVQRLKKESNL